MPDCTHIRTAVKQQIIGIDVGTSVIKAVAFDTEGRAVNAASRESGVQHPRPSWAEADMEAILEAVLHCLRELVEVDPQLPAHVLGIGVTGQGDGTWLLDSEGRPVRPAITWLDGRVGSQIELAQRSGVTDRVFNFTGTAINTSNQAAQLRWLKDHEPESIQRAAVALRAKDWIFYSLTGVIRTDFTDASFTYFDIRKRRYADEVLELHGIPELRRLLPEAVPSYEDTAALSEQAARRTGIRAGTPVAAGPIDVAASDLGMGAIQPGDACSILGTAGIHQLVMDRVETEPRGVGYTMCHAPDHSWLRFLPTMTGTLNIQWFVREFYPEEQQRLSKDELWASLEDRVNDIALGADGVMYLPYIDPAGERVPFVKPTARAQFCGLSVRNSRDTLLRAVYEGVVLSALDCYSYLSDNISRLKLTGGGAKSGLWCRMLADALSCPVDIAESVETGAKGAMINAAVAFGLFADYQEACARTVHETHRYDPVPGERIRWMRLLELYRESYRTMFHLWDRFNELFREEDAAG